MTERQKDREKMDTQATITANGLFSGLETETHEECERQISLCMDWIRQVKTIKTINRRRTSYSYKHYVEDAYGSYVSNEAFVVAAQRLGVKSQVATRKVYEDCGRPICPNFWFNFSETSLKKLVLSSDARRKLDRSENTERLK